MKIHKDIYIYSQYYYYHNILCFSIKQLISTLTAVLQQGHKILNTPSTRVSISDFISRSYNRHALQYNNAPMFLSNNIPLPPTKFLNKCIH